MKNKKAFSLIELIVVVTIIGILSSVAIYSFVGSQKTARDNTRKADIEQIANALEMYKQANGVYPDTEVVANTDLQYGNEYIYIQGAKTQGSAIDTDQYLYKILKNYISPVPANPSDKFLTGTPPNGMWKTKYLYKPLSNFGGQKYILFTWLETGKGGNSPNKKCYYAGYQDPDLVTILNSVPIAPPWPLSCVKS